MDGDLLREGLPAADRDVDVDRVQLDSIDAAADCLAGDDGRARTAERLVDRVARAAVVLHRSAHALDWLLGAVSDAAIVAGRDGPEGGLRAVASPLAGGALADRIPRRLVLPVVVAAREGEAVLGPDDLRPDQEAGRLQALLD